LRWEVSGFQWYGSVHWCWEEKIELVSKDKCAPYYLTSKPVFFRCLPSAAKDVIDSFNIKNREGQNVTGKEIKFSEMALMTLMNMNNLGMQIADELKAVWFVLICLCFHHVDKIWF
jgi:hypothetical protein